MTDTSVVLFDPQRAVITGVTLPTPPPTRVSISGYSYRIAAPRVPLPPIANVAKVILNWVGPAARIAKNIFYVLKGAGTGSTSDPAWLTALANQVMTSWGSAAMPARVATQWSLNSVTCKDAGGTSVASGSSHAAIPGTATGGTQPPGVSVALSWKVADSYKGGKPRLYLPGIPFNAVDPGGDSALVATYATNLEIAARAWLANMNSASVVGTVISVGSVSYHSGHVVRPVPQFRTYLDVVIHERVDSQRRRNGKEATFPVTP